MVVQRIALLQCDNNILFDYRSLYCYHLLFVITISYSNTFNVCEYHCYCEVLQIMVGVKVIAMKNDQTGWYNWRDSSRQCLKCSGSIFDEVQVKTCPVFGFKKTITSVESQSLTRISHEHFDYKLNYMISFFKIYYSRNSVFLVWNQKSHPSGQ